MADRLERRSCHSDCSIGSAARAAQADIEWGGRQQGLGVAGSQRFAVRLAGRLFRVARMPTECRDLRPHVSPTRARLSARRCDGCERVCVDTPARLGKLSYQLCYRDVMAQREKRSISLPPELAAEIDKAAASEGTTVSAWIATTAAHRLRLDAGRQGIAAWERQHGALTAEELANGLARARAMLGREGSKRKAS